MSLPNYTPLNYRIWHYTYLIFCGLVFFFLIAPLFVILPLSFNAEQYIHFSANPKTPKPLIMKKMQKKHKKMESKTLISY